METTKKEAKRLSILKWEFIIANGGDYEPEELPEELQGLVAQCGYCDKYEYCKDCPLYLRGTKDCGDDDHPWRTWHCNQTVENAQAMLDLILKT